MQKAIEEILERHEDDNLGAEHARKTIATDIVNLKTLTAEELEHIKNNVVVSNYPESKGGQSVNYVCMGIQIEYPSEDIIVSCKKYRSQLKNRNACLHMIEQHILSARIQGERYKIFSYK